MERVGIFYQRTKRLKNNRMKKIHLLFSLVLLMGNNLFAQLDVKNTGIVYISAATDTFFIPGAFTNASGSAFTNNGVVQVKKDITNDQASMAAGTGKLFLNGSSVQTVSGSQTFKTYNLTTNNAAGITLNNNLSVAGVHTYTTGMITTSANNFMIYEAGSSYTGSSDARHVNGWVKKIGSTNFTFPVGNATYERPVALTNLTASGEFNVKHNPSPTPNRLSTYNPLVYIDTFEYWTINKISGAAAQIAMNWNNSKIRFPNLMISDIRVANYDGTFWRSIGGTATGSALTTGNVTSSSVSIFNRNFTFGSIAYTLPLKIISFTAGRSNDFTKLNWTIGSEQNVTRYELQRSDDGISFYTIYTQLPFNRNSTEFYGYDDKKYLSGTAFYRLKIIGLGTQINYSHIVTVSANTNGKEFYVITNPVDVAIDLYAGSAIKGLYNYTIVNTAGQVMQAGTLDIKNAGSYSIYLKPTIVAGAYVLVVQNETNRLQRMIIKK
jgi:hypothetical protein